jgi:hypothetical protein
MDKVYCDICGQLLEPYWTLEFGKFVCAICRTPYNYYSYDQHGKLVSKTRCLFKVEDYPKYKAIFKQFGKDLTTYSTDPSNRVLARKKEEMVNKENEIEIKNRLDLRAKLEKSKSLSLNDIIMCIEWESKINQKDFCDLKVTNHGVLVISNALPDHGKFYSKNKLLDIYIKIQKLES